MMEGGGVAVGSRKGGFLLWLEISADWRRGKQTDVLPDKYRFRQIRVTIKLWRSAD